MSENYRHHHAVQVIFVETPQAGSPAWLHRSRPPAYPQQDRRPWQPQRFIPAKQRKAERIVEIMRELAEREADARSMLKPTNAAGLKAWLGRAA